MQQQMRYKIFIVSEIKTKNISMIVAYNILNEMDLSS
jgi:hypothetical protein